MTVSQRLSNIKQGFLPAFWTANVMELFERLAYYGQATILSIFLRDHLKLPAGEAGNLSSVFGGLIYLLPIFAGAIADKIGFRKAFLIAFTGLAAGYFLIGATGMSTLSPLLQHFPVFWFLFIVFIITAMAGAFIKPSVLGTVADTSDEKTKSLGYAIYYWLVNIGAAIGPYLAFLVRDSFGIQFVYVVSSLSCAAMAVVTFLFYKDPPKRGAVKDRTPAMVLADLLKVLVNFRFIIFLMIFGLYWVLFWQFFIIIPYYITDFVDKNAPAELIISIGAWTIILFQLPVNALTKKIKTQTAIILGFLFAAATWIIWYVFLPSTAGSTISLLGYQVSAPLALIGFGIFLFSIGEQIQAPRFYEYISDIAPAGQTALFQGYAFLPIAIAWGFGGSFGGKMYEQFGKDSASVMTLFLILAALGIFATIAMIVYTYLGASKK